MGKFLLIPLLLVLLTSCGTNENTSGNENLTASSYDSQASAATLDSVNVSRYRAGTTREQPELIVSFFEKSDLDQIAAWFESSGAPNELSENVGISKIEIVVLFYKTDNLPLKSKGYMYAVLTDGSGFTKAIPENQNVPNRYPYDESMNSDLVKAIGLSGWREMGPQQLF